MTTTETVVPARAALPRLYKVWLAGTLTSLLGNTALYFALGWAATAHGGTVAGLTLTMINIPRACLLLVGGAVGDRFGARRVMITCDSVMLATTVILAVATFGLGAPTWLLLCTGLIVGIVDAFYLPASGSMPRRLVGKDNLPQALALQQTGNQVVTLAGGPIGGILVALAGLAGVAVVDAITFALVLCVLIAIRSAISVDPPSSRQNIFKQVAEGIRVAMRHPVLRPSLILTAAAAGFLLPVIALLIPLFCRSQHWSVTSAGIITGAQSGGVLLVALSVVRFGRLRRQGISAAGGLAVASAGIGSLALAPSVACAAGFACLAGAGLGLFTTHIGPLILGTAPEEYLSRIQALLVFVQSVTLLAMNNVLGNLARFAGPAAALVTCALVLLVTAAIALGSPSLRRVDSVAS
ncbi:MFS transporter [Streptomyces lavenduligriseus]|nr:MFS transporter [Streptomyces lavenduligriseus]